LNCAWPAAPQPIRQAEPAVCDCVLLWFVLEPLSAALPARFVAFCPAVLLPAFT
jgi:hypothetical protein